MATSTVTSEFANFFSNLQLHDIPPNIRTAASSLLLDTLTCMQAASSAAPAQRIKDLSQMFQGPGYGSLVGSSLPVGTARALYANARLGNLLDLDETYPVGVHFGVGAVCAAIVAAEAEERSGADLITGIVAGYEAGARLASAIGPMMEVRDGEVKGFASIWGVAAPVVVAACVGYARVVNIDAAGLSQALGIACSNIPLPIGNRWSEAIDLPDCKYCDAGWCAVTGQHGVVAAKAGLTGFSNILDGAVGVIEACGAAMPLKDSLTSGLGERWHLADITYKPWPTCRFMHAPMTALDRLLQRLRPMPDEIDEVVIYTGPLANSARFRNVAPKTFGSYSFSYQHAVAMMILGVPAGAMWFDADIAESTAALKLRQRVRIERFGAGDTFARDMVDNQIRKMPGAATITIRGQAWTESSDYAAGDPWDVQTLFDWASVKSKFTSLASDVTGAQQLLDWITQIESTATLEPLSAFIRAGPVNH
ncbi:2-methylcitrate dehydratase PrpD [Aaosphaeria arxii CBS 175.79]|uniref:2-methylcitrate dehydratase PrpD n=1 Tax=Aaosphaeria arxii CBS 175.79 TaxID=1450172 RepID=A0A6A5Y650_9PLEO|nr:2-methylcitrate dehydratase PrpD [Aaosphaeria arxii CBS 175.79]KAF2021035.1 2-methylcitrate dehydratase PrpD [Aaosphaeria arxii CBS 175.79]